MSGLDQTTRDLIQARSPAQLLAFIHNSEGRADAQTKVLETAESFQTHLDAYRKCLNYVQNDPSSCYPVPSIYEYARAVRLSHFLIGERRLTSISNHLNSLANAVAQPVEVEVVK